MNRRAFGTRGDILASRNSRAIDPAPRALGPSRPGARFVVADYDEAMAEARKAVQVALVEAEKAAADAKGGPDLSLVWGVVLLAAAWVALIIMWAL